MEYIYAALLLNSAGKEINEEGIKKILTAAGAKPDESRIKALVAALDGVDIKEAISKAAPVATTSVAPQEEKKEEVKEEKEKKVSEQEAVAGLGALFG